MDTTSSGKFAGTFLFARKKVVTDVVLFCHVLLYVVLVSIIPSSLVICESIRFYNFLLQVQSLGTMFFFLSFLFFVLFALFRKAIQILQLPSKFVLITANLTVTVYPHVVISKQDPFRQVKEFFICTIVKKKKSKMTV